MPNVDLQHIEIPASIPVMTLPGSVLFPQVIMPLYIFEERYRMMLKDVLQGSRMFGILTREESESDDGTESFHRMGSLGMVRTSHDNPDGTSNVLLQGLTRFNVSEILQEEPYRMVKIEPVKAIADEAHYPFLINRVLDLLKRKNNLGAEVPKDIMSFLSDLENEETFVEFASFTLSDDTGDRLKLLKTLKNSERFEGLIEVLEKQVDELMLFQRFRQGQRPEDLGFN